jgi:glucose-6-phosphate 1-dehydrogenase
LSVAAKSSAKGCLFVMFGATGDLMRRKLLPALFQLAAGHFLPKHYRIIGIARAAGMTDASFRAWAAQVLADAGIADDAARRRWCDAHLHYQCFSGSEATDFARLAARIDEVERAADLPGNRVLYLALPPQAFPLAIGALAQAGLAHSRGWTRLLVEKPFGHDLASARHLNELLHRHFDETQVYRIDHYLAKETVQNLLAFRFGNALFESAWNREHIKSVQLTVAESLGVEGRAAYYEKAGALRDIVQNHLTQLLTLTAMEVPAAFDADSIRQEKIKVLRSLQPIAADAVVFGQYAAGGQSGASLPGYREEPGVAGDSAVDTFVALRLAIENWRWQGVPFYLRTGKRLTRRSTQIVIEFREPPIALFRAIDCCTPHTNLLSIKLQPDEGFNLSFDVKSPGNRFTLETRHMEFRYAEAFGAALSAGYETLLLDVLEGDQTLFVHADETEASWRLYEPWLQRAAPPEAYPAGSWGPAAADRLVAASGATWCNR